MTPPTRREVTPASKALPPFNSVSNAAAVVRGCPVEIPAVGPMTAGRSAGARRGAGAGGGCCEVTSLVPPTIRTRRTIAWRNRQRSIGVPHGRTKNENQERRTKNEEPRTKNQERRTTEVSTPRS